MIVKIILGLVVLVNGAFAFSYIKDLIAHKGETMKEPGNPFVMAISSFILFFLSTFGISDFVIGTILYRKMKWIDDKKLPGTLNTECVIPVAVMALAYISAINVELKTLIIPIIAQMTGAYVGPRFLMKLNANTIKKFIPAGLIIAAALILMGKFGLYPSGGEAVGLSGIKLAALGILSLVYGALNNIGIGSYTLTMATVYSLGLNPGAAFPIMLGACTFSVPVSSMQFIKLNGYSRKITLFTSTFGVIGVLVAAFIVKSLSISALQWLVAAILIYSSLSMIIDIVKNTEARAIVAEV